MSEFVKSSLMAWQVLERHPNSNDESDKIRHELKIFTPIFLDAWGESLHLDQQILCLQNTLPINRRSNTIKVINYISKEKLCTSGLFDESVGMQKRDRDETEAFTIEGNFLLFLAVVAFAPRSLRWQSRTLVAAQIVTVQNTPRRRPPPPRWQARVLARLWWASRSCASNSPTHHATP